MMDKKISSIRRELVQVMSEPVPCFIFSRKNKIFPGVF